MKYLKILPAAASIIALTATIGFARDMREVEEGDAFRVRIEMRESRNSAEDITGHAMPVSIKGETSQIYRVEIEQGNKTKVVAIDAYTGRILGMTDMAVKKS